MRLKIKSRIQWSQVLLQDRLPSLLQLNAVSGAKQNLFIIFYDQKLSSNPKVKAWLRQFPHAIGLEAGEKLKTLDQFGILLKKLDRIYVIQNRPVTLVAMGGGSVGDAIGFLASVYRRGVPLIHIPSTWLAAVDSSHGGKTALNLDRHKNQVGSFYQARAIFVVRELLEMQGNLAQESLGEFAKLIFLGRSNILNKLEAHTLADDLWKILPQAIKAKYKIVGADPFETLGLRRHLNLGHTLGHAIELEKGLPHGVAVLIGLNFAIRWSMKRRILNRKQGEKVLQRITELIRLPRVALKAKTLREALLRDKKRISEKLEFIFPATGYRVQRQSVGVREIIDEAHRQGLL